MRSFNELLKESSATHGHRCAGQVLGVRMAMVGCREVGIDEPRGCKKLLVYIEMDRCATDAIQSVTGCSLGKRTLKFLDYGKMAATFVNTETRKASRVVARDDAREHAAVYAPGAADPRDAQRQAYAIMPEELLFGIQEPQIHLAAQDLPNFRSQRVFCDICGEGINLCREIRRSSQTLCIPCAQRIDGSARSRLPARLHIVGFKKVGKTSLIEKLVTELSDRGYRVGTIKHHHSDISVELDAVGTDTWRHRKAGAVSVALMTAKQVALFRDARKQDSLETLLQQFTEHDIVLVEGFHEEPGVKIEVLSEGGDPRLCRSDASVIATVGGPVTASELPSFAPSAIGPLTDFLERILLAAYREGRSPGRALARLPIKT